MGGPTLTLPWRRFSMHREQGSISPDDGPRRESAAGRRANRCVAGIQKAGSGRSVVATDYLFDSDRVQSHVNDEYTLRGSEPDIVGSAV